MLAWLFRHFPLLRRVAGLPSLFDALLLGWTTLFHPERLRSLHALEKAVLSWPDVTTRMHRFGGTEFKLGRREIGHLHGNGLLDIPFTRTLRDEAVQAGRAQPHHIFPRSAWVSYYLRTEADVPGALALLHRNYARWQDADWQDADGEQAGRVDVL